MHWFERKHHAGRIIWSRLTLDQLSPAACQMYHFQADPSTVIVISHCPSPKISSPSWIVQKRQFWRQASGSAPCSVTHYWSQRVIRNAHSIGLAYGNAHIAFHSSPHIPHCSPSYLPSFLHLLFTCM